jgi:hypothetical protein
MSNQTLESGVPTIFDGIVGSTWHAFGYFSPAIAQFSMKLDDLSVVGVSPFRLIDIRIKVIVPSFTTCNNNS